jgi:hypothetical protein
VEISLKHPPENQKGHPRLRVMAFGLISFQSGWLLHHPLVVGRQMPTPNNNRASGSESDTTAA